MKRGRLAILSAILLLGSGVGTPRPARAQVTTPGRNTASPPAALIDEVLSSRNRMEEDLRVLTDEIGDALREVRPMRRPCGGASKPSAGRESIP